MEGKVDSSGTCTLSYNPSQGDVLLSPDGSQQLLPCERCGAPKWVHVRVVSFLCSACDEEMDRGVEMTPNELSYSRSCTNGSVYRD